jgi:outer membrane beta-barrel protein
MLNRKLLALLLLASIAAPGMVHAQESEATEDLNVIELEMNKAAPKKPAPVNSAPAYEDAKENNMTDFQGLSGLAPFQEISVIQKRFMPKTGRFELFGGATLVTNDPWFTTMGGVLKAGYFLTEEWGVEFNYFALTSSEREAAKELQSNNNVKTESLSFPKSYMGVDVVYAPIYGKMTWFNDRIVPFDLYFAGGYGTTNTSSGDNAGTIHLATGQIFAITKSVAFRWDFSWNFYNATVEDSAGKAEQNSFNNLFLTVGMSWFFPEASYR